MKILKKLFGLIALILILGGIFVLSWQYFRNKQLFVVLLSNSIVKGSIDVLKKMAYASIAIVIGLVSLVISMKFGSIARRHEKEKQAEIRARAKEEEEKTRQIRDEAERAKLEAEEAKREAEQVKNRYLSNISVEEEKVEE